MQNMMVPRLHLALALAVLAAAAGLGAAFASEWYGGLVPCALCLVERWPYRIAIAAGLLGLVLPRPIARLMLGLVAVVMLVSMAMAVVHIGVERQLWPSPLPECAAPKFSAGSMAQRLASMPTQPSKPCDDPTYLIPAVPISMATMNLLLSLGIAGGIAAFLTHRARS